jgi:hypothetical protein
VRPGPAGHRVRLARADGRSGLQAVALRGESLLLGAGEERRSGAARSPREDRLPRGLSGLPAAPR